jgi:predicted transcriptional regulator
MVEKDIKIMIGDRDELDLDIQRFFDDPSLIDKEPEDILFLTPSQFSAIFTKNRVETLKKIGEMKPKTMNDLAKILNRPKESVSRDVGVLTKAGMISIEAHGIYKTPKVVSRNLSVSF